MLLLLSQVSVLLQCYYHSLLVSLIVLEWPLLRSELYTHLLTQLALL
jgi:hypothetical protein